MFDFIADLKIVFISHCSEIHCNIQKGSHIVILKISLPICVSNYEIKQTEKKKLIHRALKCACTSVKLDHFNAHFYIVITV